MGAEQSKLIGLIDIVPQKERRRIASSAIHRLTRQEMITEDNAIQRLELLMKNGAGALVLSDHFGKWEPILLIADLLHANPVVRSRPLLSPIGDHQNSPSLQEVATKLDIRLVPTLTPNAMQYYKQHPELGKQPSKKDQYDTLQNFISQAVDTVAKGGTAFVPIQGEKRDWLGQPTTALSMILEAAKEKGVTNIALLFVGIGRKGVNDYSRRDVREKNILFVSARHVLFPRLTKKHA